MVSFYSEESLGICPTVKLGTTPFLALRLFILYICGYPVYWRLLLHLQSEDVPCLSDSNPLTMESLTQYSVKSVSLILLWYVFICTKEYNTSEVYKVTKIAFGRSTESIVL